MINIVGVSGSLGRPSRTRSLVELILNKAEKNRLTHTTLIDIADVAPTLGSAINFNDLPAPLLAAYQTLQNADIIVIATPVYKASYTGLLKHF